MRTKAAVLLAALGAAGLLVLFAARPAAAAKGATSGALTSIDPHGNERGLCPLKHTAVRAEISGPLSRVTVTQVFENPYPEKIEAVYTFPLPHHAAVDDMTMLVGDRVVRGKIKRREEARAIYDAARARGQVAGLLDQERPNIFRQAVANIAPGATVKITISYVETMEYEDGAYQFTFPMVVGPRYIPQGTDGARISPPVTPPGARAGHDISLQIALDAGVPLDAVASGTHEVAITRPDARRALVTLKGKAAIPNKDFVLRYDVAGRRVEDAVLTHHGARGGFFALLLQPPERVPVAEITPKELVFVLDTSGSMMGFPIEKAKETMRLALDGLHPRDTFNLITFSGDTHVLFPAPVAATAENLARAQAFLASRSGSGGTEMMRAIRTALEGPETGRVRVVCFMTDGYVGNDAEIIAEVRRHPRARVFSFGIGNSVNRYLLDGMARHGRGEVEYLALNQDGSAAARRFHERVQSPLLTDISIDWGGLPVADVSPQLIPDLFAAKPLVITGRYTAPAGGTVRLRGSMAGREFSREILVNLPAAEPRHDVLATLWARRRVEELMAARGKFREEIVQLGLDYRLMTAYTSFVAVEESTVVEGGQPRTIEVPVEMPEGVSYEGVFGSEMRSAVFAPAAAQTFLPGGGVIGGVIGGVPRKMGGLQTAEMAAPPPAPGEAKLAPSLIRLWRASLGSAQPAKVRVQVYLANTSEATLAALKKIGFEVTALPRAGSIVTGRIAADKLKTLADLPAVRYCAPLV